MSGFGAQRKEQPYSHGEDSDAEDGNCKDSLLSVIESQIIPRLLEAHPSSVASNAQIFNTVYEPQAFEIEAFADLCLCHDPKDALRFVENLLQLEVASESIFLNLLAPAARHLGERWEQDRADFTQVTMGLLHMHQITHRLGYEYQSGPKKVGPVRRMMLASAPGSQHILGLAMVSEIFRKDGWDVVVEVATTESELFRAAQNEWFDLIGLSVGTKEQLESLPEMVRSLKLHSHNPQTPVLLGGPAFIHAAASAHSLGANAISTDALEALRIAASLVEPHRHTS
jgi:methanogenic corrinoid protein MtbC1